MPPVNYPTSDTIPEDHLRLALRSPEPEARMANARAGLAFPPEALEADTKVLLLRQVYIGQLELHRFRAAVDTAGEMAAVGPLKDIALHDRARAEQAMGDVSGAIASQRMAARHAPAERRSFMLWSLATIQHFSGDIEGALGTIDKGLLIAGDDRALLKAHWAYICLENDEAVEDLKEVRANLNAAKCGEGYGQYILGMIAYHMGDMKIAIVHLQHFLRRNASVDAAKALTLREEFRRARLTLAELVSE
ncbi:MAG: tetratricopeptide (TPR) repeat protein [Polyangiales bacterium]|jgi:tetratricopeptide (TPR) repeat protein